MSSSSQFISGVSATNSARVVTGTVHGSIYFGDNENSPLNRLPYAIEAPFNAYNRRHEPTCLPETRVDLLQQIYAWAEGRDARFIFWLNGLAGTGKSTIARTVARKYSEDGQLGASFFFSRGGGDVGHAEKFFTTIAAQLSKKSQFLKQHICDAIKKNSDIATQSLGDQWRQLICGPLSKLSEDSSLYILVIDALDECTDDKDIRTIIQLLAEAQSLRAVRLRVFLTSRPEIPVRHGFYQIPETEHQDFILHNISRSIVDHDIRIYLEYNFRLISQECSLGTGWPGAQVITCLVHNASGLFIWVATTCRFIQEGRRFAAKRLAMILENSSNAITAPEKHLDNIYITVLRHSIFSEHSEEEKEMSYDMLRYILGGIVVLSSPMPPYSLRKLLHLSKEEFDQTLNGLHAILEVPEDQARPLHLHHPSFRDFLLDENRCNDSNFWVDQRKAHQKLASSCIKLLSTSLKEDICGVIMPGTHIYQVESSRMEQFIPLDVQYACLYWVHHVRRSGVQLRDDDGFDKFLRIHFLRWLETLSWMQKLTEGIREIISLQFIAMAASCPSLYAFIQDMKRFALHNRATIEWTPLQVYCSALLFTPVTSLVRQSFMNKLPHWIKRAPVVEENWSSTLQVLEGYSGCVKAVAFSPDGKQLASGSDDETVQIWDPATGARLQVLRGHSSNVSTVAFSPDGKHLASGSHDKTVRVWDAATGALLHFLEGHSDTVRVVSWLPNSKELASGSDDMTVRIWDAVTGVTLEILKGRLDEAPGVAVAFSPDGKQLASVLDDQTVRVWHAATGRTLRFLQARVSEVNAIAFSPDGKEMASGSYDKTVRVWDVATGINVRILWGHSSVVMAVAFSPDSKQLASGSGDKTVYIWDAATGVTKQILHGHSSAVSAVAFLPDNKQLASGSDDKTVRIWDAATGSALRILHDYSRDHSTVAVAFSGIRTQPASALDAWTVPVWDMTSRETQQLSHGHSKLITAVAFSPDGRQLASGSEDTTVHIWDVATGVTLKVLQGHLNTVSAVAFSPSNKVLASGSCDETVRTWDIATGEELQKLIFNGPVNTLYYADMRSIVTDYGRHRLWSYKVQAPSLPIDHPLWSQSLPIDHPLWSLSPTYRPSIVVGEEWILHREKIVLWLPVEYRPVCSAIHAAIVCLALRSGRVVFVEFSPYLW